MREREQNEGEGLGNVVDELGGEEMEGERENKVGKKERGTEKWEITRREGKGWKLTITEYLYINGKPP